MITQFFTWEFLTKNNLNVVPDTPYFSLFSPLKIKLKDRHFDTDEVIEAESQAVLNTLTGHNFQDEFKNGRSDGNGVYTRKGTASRITVASRSEISFLPHGGTSQRKYGRLFTYISSC
jgi:hypothetical protein